MTTTVRRRTTVDLDDTGMDLVDDKTSQTTVDDDGPDETQMGVPDAKSVQTTTRRRPDELTSPDDPTLSNNIKCSNSNLFKYTINK